MSEFVPAGRLTLTSDAPIMTSDVTGATIVYYAPYVGNIIPLYNGTSYLNSTFTLLTLPLEATQQVADSLYDVFAFLDVNKALTIGFGPAWTSTTARGTGAGTTEIERVNGLWLNANAMTLNNCATPHSIGPNRGTYLGTVATTSTAGQTAMQFTPAAATGGNNTWVGVFNAYNRVPTTSNSSDSSTWNYASSTWRSARTSTSERVTWVDGLGYVGAYAQWSSNVGNAADGYNSQWAVGFNSTTAPGYGIPGAQNTVSITSGGGYSATGASQNTFPGALGLNYAQALEIVYAGTATFNGANLVVLLSGM